MIQTLLTLMECSRRFSDYWALGAFWDQKRIQLAATAVGHDCEGRCISRVFARDLSDAEISYFLARNAPIWAARNTHRSARQIRNAIDAADHRFEDVGIVLISIARQSVSGDGAKGYPLTVITNLRGINNAA